MNPHSWLVPLVNIPLRLAVAAWDVPSEIATIAVRVGGKPAYFDSLERFDALGVTPN
jgi:hypothetical protein